MKGKWIWILAGLIGMSGCASGGKGEEGGQSSQESQTPKILLKVDNGGFSDLVLYAIVQGEKIRIGSVNGHSEEVIRIRKSLLLETNEIQIGARSIGGGAFEMSEAVVRRDGGVLMLSIDQGGHLWLTVR